MTSPEVNAVWELATQFDTLATVASKQAQEAALNSIVGDPDDRNAQREIAIEHSTRAKAYTEACRMTHELRITIEHLQRTPHAMPVFQSLISPPKDGC